MSCFNLNTKLIWVALLSLKLTIFVGAHTSGFLNTSSGVKVSEDLFGTWNHNRNNNKKDRWKLLTSMGDQKQKFEDTKNIKTSYLTAMQEGGLFMEDITQFRLLSWNIHFSNKSEKELQAILSFALYQSCQILCLQEVSTPTLAILKKYEKSRLPILHDITFKVFAYDDNTLMSLANSSIPNSVKRSRNIILVFGDLVESASLFEYQSIINTFPEAHPIKFSYPPTLVAITIQEPSHGESMRQATKGEPKEASDIGKRILVGSFHFPGAGTTRSRNRILCEFVQLQRISKYAIGQLDFFSIFLNGDANIQQLSAKIYKELSETLLKTDKTNIIPYLLRPAGYSTTTTKTGWNSKKNTKIIPNINNLHTRYSLSNTEKIGSSRDSIGVSKNNEDHILKGGLSLEQLKDVEMLTLKPSVGNNKKTVLDKGLEEEDISQSEKQKISTRKSTIDNPHTQDKIVKAIEETPVRNKEEGSYQDMKAEIKRREKGSADVCYVLYSQESYLQHIMHSCFICPLKNTNTYIARPYAGSDHLPILFYTTWKINSNASKLHTKIYNKTRANPQETNIKHNLEPIADSMCTSTSSNDKYSNFIIKQKDTKNSISSTKETCTSKQDVDDLSSDSAEPEYTVYIIDNTQKMPHGTQILNIHEPIKTQMSTSDSLKNSKERHVSFSSHNEVLMYSPGPLNSTTKKNLVIDVNSSKNTQLPILIKKEDEGDIVHSNTDVFDSDDEEVEETNNINNDEEESLDTSEGSCTIL